MSQISRYEIFKKFGNENKEDQVKVKWFIYLLYLLAKKCRWSVLLDVMYIFN